MIVAGEASESDDEEQTTSNRRQRQQHQQQQQLPPHRLGLASQFTSTVSSVTEAVGKQLGNLSRQATLDGVMGVVEGGVADDDDAEEAEEDSLLHQKLFEKNLSLKKKIGSFCSDEVGRRAKTTADWSNNCNRTQALMQDTVLSLQQANHFAAEADESIDDCIDWGKRIEWPGATN